MLLYMSQWGSVDESLFSIQKQANDYLLRPRLPFDLFTAESSILSY